MFIQVSNLCECFFALKASKWPDLEVTHDMASHIWAIPESSGAEIADKVGYFITSFVLYFNDFKMLGDVFIGAINKFRFIYSHFY